MKKNIFLPSIFHNGNSNLKSSPRYNLDYTEKKPRMNLSLEPKYRHIKENKKRDQILEGKI